MTAKYYYFKESFSRNGILNSGNFAVERESLGGKKLASKWVSNPDGTNGIVTVQNGYASITNGSSALTESDNGFFDALGDAAGLKLYGRNIMNALYNASTHYDFTFSPGLGLVSPNGIVGNVYVSFGKYFSKEALYKGLISTQPDPDFFDFFAAIFYSYSIGGAVYVQNGKISPNNNFYPWYWLWYNPDIPNADLSVTVGGPDRFIAFQSTSLQGQVKKTKDKNDTRYKFYGTGIVRLYEDTSSILKNSVDLIASPRSLKFIDSLSAKKKPIKSLVRNVQYDADDNNSNEIQFNPNLIDKIENINISNSLNSKFSKTISVPHGKTSISTNVFTGLIMGSYLNVSPKIYDLNFWQGPSSGWGLGRI